MMRGSIYTTKLHSVLGPDGPAVGQLRMLTFVRTFAVDTPEEFKAVAKLEYDGADTLEFGPIAPPWGPR